MDGPAAFSGMSGVVAGFGEHNSAVRLRRRGADCSTRAGGLEAGGDQSSYMAAPAVAFDGRADGQDAQSYLASALNLNSTDEGGGSGD